MALRISQIVVVAMAVCLGVIAACARGAGDRVGDVDAASAERALRAALCVEARYSHDRRPLHESLRVESSKVVAFYSDDSFDTLSVSGMRGDAVSASLCVGESLIAILSIQVDTSGGEIGSGIVARLNGEIVAEFPGDLLDAAWSPEAAKLALVRGRILSNGDPAPAEIAVWDAATRAVRAYPVSAMNVGWYDSTTLLLDDWRGISELDLVSGKVQPSIHKGIWVSPDHRYSLGISPEGEEILWDAVDKVDRKGDVLKAVQSSRLTFDLQTPPFWVGTKDSHWLAVPVLPRLESRDHEAGEGSGYLIELVDVSDGEVRRKIPGRLLVPSTDQRGALVSSANGVRYVQLGQ